MKKKAVSKSSRKPSASKNGIRTGLDSLVVEVRSLVHSARHAVATAVNTLQVQTNFEIGRRIVEYEQKGTKRASYGSELLNGLSTELTQEFGSGFSATNLKLMRQFFLEFSGGIGQTLSDQSVKPKGLRATFVRLADENPTVGLVLCKQKKAAVVELTLPKDSNIHARQYRLYLPSKKLLQKKLLEWSQDEQVRS